MSTWRKVKDRDDVEVSEDGKTLDILYMFDHNGNNYVEVPIEFVRDALKVYDEKKTDQ